MDLIRIEFRSHETERLVVLRDHLAGTIHRPELTIDEMVRWCLETAGRQFNLGAWPQPVAWPQAVVEGSMEGIEESSVIDFSDTVGPSLGEDGEPETKPSDETVPPPEPPAETGPEISGEAPPDLGPLDGEEPPVSDEPDAPTEPPEEIEAEKPPRRGRRAQE
jgi:hypothetical protein